jgi:FkbM family methyltransferase
MPTVEHIAVLRTLNPRTVLDVGANRGQFSVVARHLFPTAKIYAFEPLESERRIYESVVSGPVQMYSLALGATKGSARFFVASRTDSSSLLSPGENQEAAYGVGLATTINVDVERLADVLKPGDLVGPVFLKLDVQGAELQVLQGADTILPLVDSIYCEVSFVELYEGQPTAGAIVSFLDLHGFALRGVFNLSSTKQFGPTQGDFWFSRTSARISESFGVER